MLLSESGHSNIRPFKQDYCVSNGWMVDDFEVVIVKYFLKV